MKLGRQLFLVSLLTLSLPLAGVQYVRQMDAQLLDSQAQALLDRTKALAVQLQGVPQLFAGLLPPPEPGSINFVSLASRPGLDGDCDDWAEAERRQMPTWKQVSSGVQYLAGAVGPDLFVCIRIPDPDIQYHPAGASRLVFGDHLVIYTERQKYWLRAEQAGPIFALYTDPLGQSSSEYSLNAFWQETEAGYQVELRVPSHVASNRLAVEVVDNGRVTLAAIGMGADARPMKYLQRQEELQRVLDRHAEIRGEALYLLSNSGSVAAERVARPEVPVVPQNWLSRLYEFLSTEDFVGDLSYPSQGFLKIGAEEASELAERVSWYRDGNNPVARALVPVDIGGIRVATLVADEPARTLSEINSSALTRLIWYSGSAFALTSLGLIGYALWLSSRIRHLSRATSMLLQDGRAVSEQKRAFRASGYQDELGELSRQYAGMMQRIEGYTEYLQSLSGKLSHEIRTPLAIVRSSLDNLNQAEDADEREKYMNRAGEGIERLAGILSAMSQSTAIEAAIEQADRHSFAPARILQDLVQAYSDIYADTPMELELVKGVEGLKLNGSADLFAQMMDKLVDNAVDFCQGKILISVGVSGETLQLVVGNDGPLLAEDMQESLFDSLVSLRDESSEKPHLGLGLFVVKRIVEFHQGQIRARNRADGSGVEFVIELPLAEP